MSSNQQEIDANTKAWLAWIQAMETILKQLKEGIISTDPTEEPTDPTPTPTEPTKPSEGTIKPGGWGANTDSNTWKITNMRNPPEQFKVVDSAGINVATNFTTEANAQVFIDYMKAQPNPPVDPVDPVDPTPVPVAGEGAYGVKAIYGNGAIDTNHSKNFRDDGKRLDFTKVKTPGVELTGYFALTSPIDDEVSGKWSTLNHSGSNKTNCYDLGVKTTGGRSRFRFEAVHPEYTGNLAEGQTPAPALGNKFIGYKFIKRLTNDGKNINLQIWVDQGDNQGSVPANQWKKIFDYTDTKYNRTEVQPYATLRIDDPKKGGLKELQFKWVQCMEIK